LFLVGFQFGILKGVLCIQDTHCRITSILSIMCEFWRTGNTGIRRANPLALKDSYWLVLWRFTYKTSHHEKTHHKMTHHIMSQLIHISKLESGELLSSFNMRTRVKSQEFFLKGPSEKLKTRSCYYLGPRLIPYTLSSPPFVRLSL
jgi:hypothetical protein